MYFDDVNWAAVVVIAILNIVLGMLWYSPQVLGKAWLEFMHFQESDCKCTVWHMVGGFISALITAWVLALFIDLAAAVTLQEGLKVGFFAWLGFVATTHFSGVLWAKKPWQAYLIDSGFYLVFFLIAGGILGVWH